MDKQSVPFLLVTANVGSVFEDPSRLLKTWIKEFLKTVTSLRPSFIALHMQEVGGKTYEKSMEYVQEFIKILCEANELREYDRIRIYLDEDYNSAEHFTALGNLYFIKNVINSLKIWNFLSHEWEVVEGKNVNTGNIESIPTKEKAKFPQNFFPECKWSRKGFLRTRWDVEGTVVDMVNIHLFHDASNLAACEEFPSVYCKSRRRALIYTLERFQMDLVNNLAPYFVFGDFNFRCDTEGVVKKLTEDLTAHKIQNIKSDNTKVQYRNSDGHNVLTVGKKEFTHADHQNKFKEAWLRQFDRELDPLKEVLFEYNITFPPSYPYEEDPQMPHSYMSTRCPAWCDRILLSPSAKKLILDGNDDSNYSIIGENVCMGDHKPVYLYMQMRSNQGIIRCSCSHEIEHNEDLNAIAANVNENSKQLSFASCLLCRKKLHKIFLDCQKLEILDTLKNEYNPKSTSLPSSSLVVSINVIDTENNLNVCMCSLHSDNDRDIDTSPMANYMHSSENSICPQCRNIINQQPTEHRRALISQRLTLANDIIVNRIDTQFLNTFSNNGGCALRQDPYTPESIESHSPLIEKDNLNYDIETVASNQQTITGMGSGGGVSPRQLKSRLERLRYASRNQRIERLHRRKKSQTTCFNCCVLM